MPQDTKTIEISDLQKPHGLLGRSFRILCLVLASLALTSSAFAKRTFSWDSGSSSYSSGSARKSKSEREHSSDRVTKSERKGKSERKSHQ